MQRSALGNVIARQEEVRREGTDRPSRSCLPGQGKVSASDDLRADRDQWVGVRRRGDGRGDGRTLQSGDRNSRRLLFASAEHHIHSRVIRRRRSSHGRCRHGI